MTSPPRQGEDGSALVQGQIGVARGFLDGSGGSEGRWFWRRHRGLAVRAVWEAVMALPGSLPPSLIFPDEPPTTSETATDEIKWILRPSIFFFENYSSTFHMKKIAVHFFERPFRAVDRSKLSQRLPLIERHPTKRGRPLEPYSFNDVVQTCEALFY